MKYLSSRKNIFRIAVVLALVFLASSTFCQKSLAAENKPNTTAELSSDSFLALINQARDRASISSVVTSPKLQKAAQEKADDMAKYNYIALNSPSGKIPPDLVKEQSYTFCGLGANLAVNFKTPEDAVGAWLTDKSDRQSILDSGFSEIGIGLAKSQDGAKNFAAVFLAMPTCLN
ncbi:MAG TPA: CAP domain-containing protein [Candidatus Bathyarchaeia archaeon]|nr:CAP domain-containing protein [Candidatus Bathyarchaeia archaeon]